MADLFGARDDPRSTLDVPRVPGLELVRRLGTGAHAEVWLGTEPATGERVAVKVALPGSGARLVRESELLQRIDHPHVIRLRRLEPTPYGVALVLDHADGGSLAELAAGRGRLDPGETTTVVVPVARALAAMHATGLVHGDVTAANVLFTRDGRPLLADLGVAADLAGPGAPDGAGGLDGHAGLGLWGTPGWVDHAAHAPGPAADVWALGALLRFCLTGDPDPSSLGPSSRLGLSSSLGESAGAGAAARLLDVATDCAATDPADRPTALAVSRAVWEACPPEPVRLLEVHARLAGSAPVGAAELTRRIRQDAVDPATAPRERRRLAIPGPSRRVLAPVAIVAGAAVLGVVAALAVMPQLLQVGRPDRSDPVALVGLPAPVAPTVSTAPAAPTAPTAPAAPTAPTATVTPTATAASGAQPAATDAQAQQVVTALALARARALSAAAEQALAEVDQPGSAALAQDLTVVRQLAGSGVRLCGLAFLVDGVRLLRSDGDRWTVAAEVTTSAHTRVDLAGRVLAQVPAAAPRAVTLELVRTADGWRVASSGPAAAVAASGG